MVQLSNGVEWSSCSIVEWCQVVERYKCQMVLNGRIVQLQMVSNGRIVQFSICVDWLHGRMVQMSNGNKLLNGSI